MSLAQAVDQLKKSIQEYVAANEKQRQEIEQQIRQCLIEKQRLK